ncbi:MAG: nucleotidyltransferase domain-containing protein [Candidatus Muiribacteriota bacterium]|jgi:predicted nucleotidyltransferase
MNNKLFGINEKAYNLIYNYFEKTQKLKKVIIYGSRALGTYEKGSDIDFAIFTESKEDLSSTISFELDELQTPYYFDVLDYNRLTNLKLKKHIDEFGKEFYPK